MCKHIAAVLYGVGARLDARPEELFLLRKANHIELIAQAGKTTVIQAIKTQGSAALENNDLSALFGIDIDNAEQTSRKQDNLPRKKALSNGHSANKVVIVKSKAKKIQATKQKNKNSTIKSRKRKKTSTAKKILKKTINKRKPAKIKKARPK